MKTLSYVLCGIFTTIFLTSCGNTETAVVSEEENTPPTEETSSLEDVANTGNIAVNYTGLTVEDANIIAESNGTVFRIVEEDGEALPVTMDYRPGRINGTVKNGIIISYTVE